MIAAHSWIALALATATSVGASASCREPTEVTIEIRTDVPCSLLQKTAIFVGAPGETETQQDPTAVTPSCTAGLVGSLVTVPASGKTAKLAVRIVTGVDRDATQCTVETQYKGCIVARRRLAYVAHTPLFVPIFMNLSCKDVPCDVRSTCNRLGRCVPADLDADECARPDGCTVIGEGGQLDGGTDATAGDSGRDGAVDAIADAARDAASDATNDATNDAADADGGGAAGRVQCPGGSDCIAPYHCCFDTVLRSGSCASPVMACPLGGSVVDIRCDGREDCVGGSELCCFIPSFGSSCAPSAGNCSGGEILCTASAQCAATCAISTQAPPYKSCQ